MARSQSSSLSNHLYIMTWLWLSMGAIFSLFMLLANLNNDVQFKAAQVFIELYLSSFVLLITLPSFEKLRSHQIDEEGERNFWAQDLTPKKLVWVAIGFPLVLLVSYMALVIQQPIVGIFISGIIMLFAFFHTRSIMIPIFIHGLYNTFVVIVQSGLLGNSIVPMAVSDTPLGVPIIGISIGQFSGLTSEVIFQNLLVATSEELFKVMIIGFILVSIKGTFKPSSGWNWFAGVIAVIIWAVMHTIQAI